MSNELNAYLESKEVTTNLKHKRQLAKAFGLPMTSGTDEEESGLLLALKVGAMANQGNVNELYRVEVAFDETPCLSFNTLFDAKRHSDTMTEQCKATRICKVLTISEIIK